MSAGIVAYPLATAPVSEYSTHAQWAVLLKESCPMMLAVSAPDNAPSNNRIKPFVGYLKMVPQEINANWLLLIIQFYHV